MYLALYVYAVEQGTRDLVEVAYYLTWSTYTRFGGVVVVSTRTRIHGGYEHEIARIVDCALNPAQCDTTVFQRLAQHFKYGATKLGELVGKEDTIVCQTYLAWLEIATSAYEGDLGDGVVGAAKWTYCDERAVTYTLTVWL